MNPWHDDPPLAQSKPYVIEPAGDSWVLGLFGRQDAMISGPTLESAKEQAFELVRQWAPCRIRVHGDVFEEWLLDHLDGEWVKVLWHRT